MSRCWSAWVFVVLTACGDARAAVAHARALWEVEGDGEPGVDEIEREAPFARAATPEDDAIAPARARWIGVVVARDVVELAAPSDGIVASLDARTGMRVHVGDRIATLDAEAEDAEVLAADATVARARAELRQADVAVEGARLVREEERSLVASGAGLRSARARAELDHRAAIAARARARAGVVEAEAQRDVRRVRRMAREIVAPFAGRIEVERTTAGAFVARGGIVVRLVGDARLIRFIVPLTETVPAVGTVLAVIDPRDGTERGLRVRHVAGEADAGAQQVAVEGELLGDGEALPSGLRVDVGGALDEGCLFDCGR